MSSLRPSKQVGIMSDSRRYSSTDSGKMRETNYKNLLTPGRSVKMSVLLHIQDSLAHYPNLFTRHLNICDFNFGFFYNRKKMFVVLRPNEECFC